MMSAMPGFAAVKTGTVDYQHEGTTLEGYVARDDSKSVGAGAGRQPGVLIIHQWKGLGEYEKARARMLAELGYVAFAVDVYGKGVRPKDAKEAGALAGKYKQDRQLLRGRLQAALEALKKQEGVDPTRIAAIGYCFGGTSAIELARSGADVKAVVSFHGGLDSPNPADGKNIKGKVLALHGADDPFVPEKDLQAFEKEMKDAGVDWQLVKYGGAVHSFTEKDAGNDNSKGAAYNEKADKRSWQAMQDIFNEVF